MSALSEINMAEEKESHLTRAQANLQKAKELEKQKLESGYRYVRCAKGRKLVKTDENETDQN